MNYLKDKKILLCGGTNFLGPHLVKKLVSKGCDITICTRGIHAIPLEKSIKTLICDCNNEEKVKKILGGRAFDIVIDSISYCPQEVFNILSNVKTNRYIQISSIGVYWDSVTDMDRKLHTSINEDFFDPRTYTGWKMEVDHTTGYGDRKKFAECVAYQMFPHCNPVSIRPAYVADPSNLKHEQNVRIPEMVDWIKCKRGINPDRKNYSVCFTRVDEEADLILKLTTNHYRNPLNISSIGYIAVEEIMEHISLRLGIDIYFNGNGKVPNFPSGLNLNVERLKDLGIVPSQLKDWFWDYLNKYIDFPIKKYRPWEIVRSEIDTFRG